MSKALTNWYITHEDFVSVNNVLREYNEMKEKIKSSADYFILRQGKPILSVVKNIMETKIQMLEKLKQ